MLKRFLLELVLLLAIVFLPWWVSVAYAVFLLFYFKIFYEIVVFGLLIDLLYGKGDYQFAIFFFGLLILSALIKPRLKLYSK